MKKKSKKVAIVTGTIENLEELYAVGSQII